MMPGPGGRAAGGAPPQTRRPIVHAVRPCCHHNHVQKRRGRETAKRCTRAEGGLGVAP